MRRIVALSITVILLLTIIFSLMGCGSKNEIEDLMSNFQKACNSLKFNEVLDCINPSISDKIKLATGFVGMFTDTDTDKMFDSLASYLSKDKVGGKEFFSSIKIDVNDIKTDGDSAKVSAVITYKIKDKEITNNTTFNCIRNNEKWYISSFLFD